TSLRTRDTALLVSLFAPGAQWVTASYGERGVSIRRRPALTDVEILKRGAETLDEQLYDMVVRVDGDIALVWAPYRFLIGGKRTHCGHDAFHLVREHGAWRLEGGVYTTRPDGC
ncbi:MAG: nuclear transport factor 2 family protein, partial [Gemmatimonadales bacterium]